MDRVLVTGASGLLGASAVLAWSRNAEVVACYGSHPIKPSPHVIPEPLDITDARQVARLVASHRPDVIVHCAAATNVDWCERHREQALAVNTEGSRHVARSAAVVGSKLVHISTDSVFPGTKGMYTEADAPGPVHVYGETKLEAERAVLSEHPSAVVVRTAIYGLHPYTDASLGTWLAKELRAHREIAGFTDVFFTPVLANDLVTAIERLLELGAEGVYHVSGTERVSKYDFARRTAAILGADPALVRAASQAASALAVARPADCSLDCSKAARLGLELPDVDGGLRRFRDILDSEAAAEIRGLVER